jgi:hypothetical protein
MEKGGSKRGKREKKADQNQQSSHLDALGHSSSPFGFFTGLAIYR